MFSFHLADVSAVDGARAMLLPPSGHGLRQVEVMARMRLGAPVVSFDRLQVRRGPTRRLTVASWPVLG